MANWARIIGVSTAAWSLTLCLPAPAEAMVPVNRCTAFVDTYDGIDFGYCGYTATSVNGMAVVSVARGAAALLIDCTVGGVERSDIPIGVHTFTFQQVGTCGVVIYPDDPVEGGTTALVDAGSTGL